MNNIRELKIGKNDGGQRLDKFLSKAMPKLPMSLMHKFLRNKNIKLNGKKTAHNEKVMEGDVLTFYISDEFFEKDNKKSTDYSDAKLNLLPDEIVFEDENLIIVDKPQGELVHPGDDDNNKTPDSCLIARITGYLFKKDEFDPQEENSFAPALCHRLDRNTGGLVIAAKNAQALRVMNLKIKERSIKKTYLCAVCGIPQKKSALLKDYLYKDSSQNRVFIFPTPQDAKRALHIKYDDDIKTVITKYDFVESLGENSILRVDLITGRTHQIRAHLAYIGHPLVGDGKYGISHGKSKSDNYQRLYAYSLRFEKGSDDGILSYLSGKEFFGKHSDIIKK